MVNYLSTLHSFILHIMVDYDISADWYKRKWPTYIHGTILILHTMITRVPHCRVVWYKHNGRLYIHLARYYIAYYGRLRHLWHIALTFYGASWISLFSLHFFTLITFSRLLSFSHHPFYGHHIFSYVRHFGVLVRAGVRSLCQLASASSGARPARRPIDTTVSLVPLPVSEASLSLYSSFTVRLL